MKKTNGRVKKTALKNDYERMVPEFHKNTIIYGEHLVRYLSAQQLVKGKVVLDIASGSGYGTYSLAQTAKKVIGVDVFADAVTYAREHYGRQNIEYRQGDGIAIPLEASSVDVVVSFETIEHIKDYRTFMAEVKRVLKPDGFFLLSTPNEVEFAEGNHFHIHEFIHGELKNLVRSYFSEVKEYFQANWIYTGIHTSQELTEEWSKSVHMVKLAPLKLNQALYFFMLCANRKIDESIKSLGIIAEHSSAREIQAKDELTQQHIANITAISDDRLAYVRRLEAIIRQQEDELALARPLQNSLIGRAYHKLKKIK